LDIVIECKGISTDIFYLPAFTLYKGETIGIYIGNNDSYSAQQLITSIIIGKIKDLNLILHQNFTFVDYVREPEWRGIFHPVTVGEYLKKNADPNTHYAQRIYEYEWINKKTKISRLPGNPRKLLSLYSALSKKRNIITDFAGQDQQGILYTFNIIKEETSTGITAVLFDIFKNFENSCDHYVEIQWKDNRKDIGYVFHFPED